MFHLFEIRMRKLPLVDLLIVAAIAFVLAGCVSGAKSFKESTLDDLSPILAAGQYDTLQSLTSDEEIQHFLQELWQEIDSSPYGNATGLKAEYLRRLEYANAHFPDRWGWG